MKDVTIIIVTRNRKELLTRCLKSIYEFVHDILFAVIVVDNASTDGTVELLKEEFSSVRVIANKENLGFARANNQAMGLCDSRYILLLNSDVVLTPGAVGEMKKVLDGDPRIGVVGCRLVLPDGRSQIGDSGYEITLFRAFSCYFFLSKFSPRIFKGLYVEDRKGPERAIEVDWVAGACFMCRSAVVKEVGMLREDFFMYNEDVEFCRRVRSRGYGILYLVKPYVHHCLGASSNSRIGARDVSTIWLDSFDYDCRQRFSRASLFLLHLILCVGLALRLFFFFLFSLVFPKSRWKVEYRAMRAFLAKGIKLLMKW